MYDGPFWVLSIVDHYTFKRILYEVLDHDSAHEDLGAFFQRFRTALETRQLTLIGGTTDGAPLYPVPLVEVFGLVAHQICEFHVLEELTQAVLHAVAKVRKSLAATMPPMGRGRPSKATKRAARRRKRIPERIRGLFERRHLFVQPGLTPTEKKILRRISPGLPQLRALRQIMDATCRRFGRRCRSATALARLAQLRSRVRRFKKVGRTLTKLFSPNLEKALTFLDDKLLPSTPNAVERGNRRHRKMQKTLYRVRSHEHITQRIALDLHRDAQASGRQGTTATLHLARTG